MDNSETKKKTTISIDKDGTLIITDLWEEIYNILIESGEFEFES